MNQLNYPGDVRESFRVGEYACNISGETMTDIWGYPLMVHGIEFDGVHTSVQVEAVGRPARGVK